MTATRTEPNTKTPYPQRQKYFAHKLTRLLFKSCACQEIGHNAVLLIIHIAHTEDAARYQGPVRFWNSQLMETLGIKSRRYFIDIRQQAIGTGWLHYEREHDRSVGKYWTIIPLSVALFDDSPIEESGEARSLEGTEGDGTCSPEGAREGTGKGTRAGARTGTPSYPVPSPSPDPKEERVSASADSLSSCEAEFIELWNKVGGVCRIRGQKLTGKRKSQFRARLRDTHWFPSFREAMGKFPLKCTVGVDDPWKPDADFILRPDSVTKILEGKYDWSKNGNGKPRREALPTGAGHKHGTGRVDTSGF